MLCIARYTGPGLIPGTSRWEVSHCADEPTVVGLTYHVQAGDEPGSAKVGLFQFEPPDQFLQQGRPLDILTASPLAIVPGDKPLTRGEGAIWAGVTICGTPHEVELLEVIEAGGRQIGAGRFRGRFEALWDFAGAAGRLGTIRFEGKTWALSIVPRLA
jgi:hypothetical protein